MAQAATPFHGSEIIAGLSVCGQQGGYPRTHSFALWTLGLKDRKFNGSLQGVRLHRTDHGGIGSMSATIALRSQTAITALLKGWSIPGRH